MHVQVTLTGGPWDSETAQLIVQQITAVNGTTVHFIKAHTRTANVVLSQVRAYTGLGLGLGLGLGHLPARVVMRVCGAPLQPAHATW